MTVKLFISYRSTDSLKVDAIVSTLVTLKDTQEQPLYRVWQDKKHMPVGQDWWESIVDAIIDCDMFVFFISNDALKSDVCKAELAYAHKRNRPIIPVVLPDEFFLNEDTGKYDIPFWNAIPPQLNDMRAQFLFYTDDAFFDHCRASIDLFLKKPQRDIDAPRPLNPDASGEGKSNHALYDEACEYAGRLAFVEAEKNFQRLAQRNDPDYGPVAYEWIEILRRYADLIEVDQRPNARFIFKRKWKAYAGLFPKEFLDGLFDPKGFVSRIKVTQETPTLPKTLPVPPKAEVVEAPPPPSDWITRWMSFKGQSNADWTPHMDRFDDLKIPDMEFCLVPPGTFLMGSKKQDDEMPIHRQTLKQPYWISRYPVTNAQWQRAVQAGAVLEPEGSQALKWYRDPKMAQAPVVGVTWFAAQAFCVWQGGRLPTECEWEYAARGVDSLLYPWGDEVSDNLAVWSGNSSYKPKVVTTHSEGMSWVGAAHMSGNVWEWMNSLYRPYPYKADDGREVYDGTVDALRALRGVSWESTSPDDCRSTNRGRSNPNGWFDGGGFRVVRSG